MPEQTNIKVKPEVPPPVPVEERHARAGGVAYAELEVTSNFSFLRSGSHPEELMVAAAESGCRAVALTDLHTAAGLVRAHVAAYEAGIPFLIGCRVLASVTVSNDAELFPAFPLELLLYPTTRAAYASRTPSWRSATEPRSTAPSASGAETTNPCCYRPPRRPSDFPPPPPHGHARSPTGALST